MAVDEALLQGAGQTSGSALRFYQWETPTLSLGYFQPVHARSDHPPSSTLPVVRRATGGGAIVHHHELTYSFVTPLRNRFSLQTQDFVGRFHESLIETLAARGVKARLCGDVPSESKEEPFLCFQRRNSLDVLIDEAKIVGSAQRRHHDALLQHGSLLISRSENAPALPGVLELSGAAIDTQELTEEWSCRLGKQFGFIYADSSLTSEELSWAEEFERSRYAHDRWTEKR